MYNKLQIKQTNKKTTDRHHEHYKIHKKDVFIFLFVFLFLFLKESIVFLKDFL